MSDKTGIEWTDATWPIVQGCDPVSPGCVHCYVVPLLWRLAHNPNPKIAAPLQGLTEKHITRAGEFLRFTGKLALREDRLDWPLLWKRPRMIFVPSHGDIFHKDVPDTFLAKIFARMELASWHTYQVLTKRSARQCDFVRRRYAGMQDIPKHIWFGVSVEDQKRADERRLNLAALAYRGFTTFVSYEPALGPVDWSGWEWLAWLISGGENGPRPSHPNWHRAARDFCRAHEIKYLFKQWGSFAPIEAYDREPNASFETLLVQPDGKRIRECEAAQSDFGNDSRFLYRVGKAKAGRLLDGVEWNEFPETQSPPGGCVQQKFEGEL